LIAVSVDDPEHAVESAKEYGIDFPVLSDPDLAAHKAFHVVDHLGGLATFMIARMGADLEQRSGREHHDVAVPSIFLIDAAGVIRWSHVDIDYGKRPSVPQLLDAIDRCGMLTAPPAAPSFPTSTGMSGRPSL
jgi:peroxiredoxin